MTELRIPAAGDAVSEVQLVEWVVEDGSQVAEGDVLYTIESDKSVLEIEAPTGGRLSIIGKAGDVFPVGELVGRID